MVETVEKRYLILVSRSPTAPKRYTALAPTRADRVSTMGPLGKLILSVCEVSGCKPGKRAQCGAMMDVLEAELVARLLSKMMSALGTCRGGGGKEERRWWHLLCSSATIREANEQQRGG